MNHAVLLLACAVVAALIVAVPKVRKVAVIAVAVLAVAVIAGQAAWVVGPTALHHLMPGGGAR